MHKNYPVIYHNGNILVVNKEADVKKGETYWDDLTSSYAGLYVHSGVEYKEDYLNGIYKSPIIQAISGTTSAQRSSWRIIAASPEAKIVSVPVIEINNIDSEKAWKEYPYMRIKDSQPTDGIFWKSGYEHGYKAAKAKQYTEEDMRKAWKDGWSEGKSSDISGSVESPNRYIASLKKKIVSVDLEMATINLNVNGPIDVFQTYPKRVDGKVIVKEVYYE